MDLDASVKISSKQNKTYIGAKSSSGVLPPEMIASIKNNEDFKKFNTYFEEMKGIDIDPEQWKKVQAKKKQKITRKRMLSRHFVASKRKKKGLMK
mmetsp:Transcript_14389/g.19706  ORF Transcript_14389/g.19706 Transcript_14389/m.19706 type:complete len:95 (-) Transcript_14389:1466-1750(-)